MAHAVGNLPVRVAPRDWSAVVTGQKRMFRAYNANRAAREHPVVPADTPVPRPCVLYTSRRHGDARRLRYEAMPGVLLSHRQEPLGSITPEDLAAEGFEFLPAFRFYWKQRYRSMGWRPWDMVSVLEVKPLHDERWAADWLFEQLYGDLNGER